MLHRIGVIAGRKRFPREFYMAVITILFDGLVQFFAATILSGVFLLQKLKHKKRRI